MRMRAIKDYRDKELQKSFKSGDDIGDVSKDRAKVLIAAGVADKATSGPTFGYEYDKGDMYGTSTDTK